MLGFRLLIPVLLCSVEIRGLPAASYPAPQGNDLNHDTSLPVISGYSYTIPTDSKTDEVSDIKSIYEQISKLTARIEHLKKLLQNIPQTASESNEEREKNSPENDFFQNFFERARTYAPSLSEEKAKLKIGENQDLKSSIFEHQYSVPVESEDLKMTMGRVPDIVEEKYRSPGIVQPLAANQIESTSTTESNVFNAATYAPSLSEYELKNLKNPSMAEENLEPLVSEYHFTIPKSEISASSEVVPGIEEQYRSPGIVQPEITTEKESTSSTTRTDFFEKFFDKAATYAPSLTEELKKLKNPTIEGNVTPHLSEYHFEIPVNSNIDVLKPGQESSSSQDYLTEAEQEYRSPGIVQPIIPEISTENAVKGGTTESDFFQKFFSNAATYAPSLKEEMKKLKNPATGENLKTFVSEYHFEIPVDSKPSEIIAPSETVPENEQQYRSPGIVQPAIPEISTENSVKSGTSSTTESDFFQKFFSNAASYAPTLKEEIKKLKNPVTEENVKTFVSEYHFAIPAKTESNKSSEILVSTEVTPEVEQYGSPGIVPPGSPDTTTKADFFDKNATYAPSLETQEFKNPIVSKYQFSIPANLPSEIAELPTTPSKPEQQYRFPEIIQPETKIENPTTESDSFDKAPTNAASLQQEISKLFPAGNSPKGHDKIDLKPIVSEFQFTIPVRNDQQNKTSDTTPIMMKLPEVDKEILQSENIPLKTDDKPYPAATTQPHPTTGSDFTKSFFEKARTYAPSTDEETTKLNSKNQSKLPTFETLEASEKPTLYTSRTPEAEKESPVLLNNFLREKNKQVTGFQYTIPLGKKNSKSQVRHFQYRLDVGKMQRSIGSAMQRLLNFFNLSK